MLLMPTIQSCIPSVIFSLPLGTPLSTFQPFLKRHPSLKPPAFQSKVWSANHCTTPLPLPQRIGYNIMHAWKLQNISCDFNLFKHTSAINCIISDVSVKQSNNVSNFFFFFFDLINFQDKIFRKFPISRTGHQSECKTGYKWQLGQHLTGVKHKKIRKVCLR